ncbi:DUF4410 domain-containing protein [Nguyenibacter vanlangensis]|uniref:DUF4410 domain-containing protein n=1 Tax=Nguyenibacter vanlangensis TaxID=1216886 RepID=A0ABZ3D3K6_9PROT
MNHLSAPRRPGRSSRMGIAPLLVALPLCACGSAHVQHVQPGAVVPFAALPPPPVLFVTVSGPGTGGQATPTLATATLATATLAADLVTELRRAGAPAALLMAGDSAPDMPVLRVVLMRADPGDAMERTVIGFGAGRSELLAHIRLDDPRRVDRRPAIAFDVQADSGRKPGLIVPAAVTLGTAMPIHMAIGGTLDLLLGRRHGLDADMADAAKAITREVRASYVAEGWSLPA